MSSYQKRIYIRYNKPTNKKSFIYHNIPMKRKTRQMNVWQDIGYSVETPIPFIYPFREFNSMYFDDIGTINHYDVGEESFIDTRDKKSVKWANENKLITVYDTYSKEEYDRSMDKEIIQSNMNYVAFLRKICSKNDLKKALDII